jgi:hypothetical protein
LRAVAASRTVEIIEMMATANMMATPAVDAA